jgi:hypothetical protein
MSAYVSPTPAAEMFHPFQKRIVFVLRPRDCDLSGHRRDKQTLTTPRSWVVVKVDRYFGYGMCIQCVWLLFAACVSVVKLSLWVVRTDVLLAPQFELSHNLMVMTPRVMAVEVYIPKISLIVHGCHCLAASSLMFRAGALKIVPVPSSPVALEFKTRERVRATVHVVSIQINVCSTTFGVPTGGLVKARVVILVLATLIVVRELVPSRTSQFETL